MEKNEELKHKESKVKLEKKNYIIIITPIIAIVLLIIIIAVYIFIISNPSNKLKNYLEKEGYSCNKESCSKNINGENHLVNYKTGIITITTSEYTISIGNNISVQSNTKDLVCTYTNGDYKKGDFQSLDKVDTSLNNREFCDKYTEKVNEKIKQYKAIMTEADVTVNKIGK